jgi:hypothetical protein
MVQVRRSPPPGLLARLNRLGDLSWPFSGCVCEAPILPFLDPVGRNGDHEVLRSEAGGASLKFFAHVVSNFALFMAGRLAIWSESGDFMSLPGLLFSHREQAHTQ